MSFHRRTPSRALRFLARDVEREVRRSAAGNPNTPVDVIRDLAAEGHLFGVAMNPRTPTDILAGLATSEDRSLRRHVAANPNAHPDALRRLAADREADVRRNAAENPATPDETIRELSKSSIFRRGVSSSRRR